jgi:hypothetical protein
MLRGELPPSAGRQRAAMLAVSGYDRILGPQGLHHSDPRGFFPM